MSIWGNGRLGSGCRMSPEFMGSMAFMAMLIVMEASPADVNDQGIKDVILNAVNTSTQVDHAVLLALDGVYKGGNS